MSLASMWISRKRFLFLLLLFLSGAKLFILLAWACWPTQRQKEASLKATLKPSVSDSAASDGEDSKAKQRKSFLTFWDLTRYTVENYKFLKCWQVSQSFFPPACIWHFTTCNQVVKLWSFGVCPRQMWILIWLKSLLAPSFVEMQYAFFTVVVHLMIWWAWCNWCLTFRSHILTTYCLLTLWSWWSDATFVAVTNRYNLSKRLQNTE